jgi:hypothetical protein
MSRFGTDFRCLPWSAVAALCAALMLAGPASAKPDEATRAPSGATPGAAEAARQADPTAPLQADGGEPYPTLHVPDDGWRYVTDYIFALTLGLEDESLEDWVRYCAMVGTVPVDLFASPGAAIAGLFGP